MLKLDLLFPLLFLLFHSNQDLSDRDSRCDLVGDWSQVSLLIEPLGKMHELTFKKDSLLEKEFITYSQQVHDVYTSGQGNIEIDSKPTLSFSKNKISYKGEKLGRYKVSDNCKVITINQTIQQSPDLFSSCNLLYRYENIIAMQQGDETIFYLRRYPKNPFFVGEND